MDFVSAWGAALTVIVDSERGFSLSREELESVTLLELPGIDDPDRGGWLVIAALTPGAQGKADSFSAAHPHSLVFVSTAFPRVLMLSTPGISV